MTSETIGGEKEIFDADAHDQEVKKEYYHLFDDETVEKMKNYFKLEQENHDLFLRYLKHRRIPLTTSNDV
jgi:hypothetical protein